MLFTFVAIAGISVSSRVFTLGYISETSLFIVETSVYNDPTSVLMVPTSVSIEVM